MPMPISRLKPLTDTVPESWKRKLRPLYVPAFELAQLRWPYPLFYAKRYFETRRPMTFNEKVRYKMLHDRRPILTTFADKVKVRDYVADRVGEQYLTECYGVYDDPWKVDWESLPREFVCKASHGSGGIIVVTELADEDSTIPEQARAEFWPVYVVHPDRFDPERAARLFDKLLAQKCGWGTGSQYEWAYQDVPSRLLIEERLRDDDGGIPADYKFFVFHGTCRMIQVDTDRMGEHRRDLYTPDWELLPVEYKSPSTGEYSEPPEHLGEMLRIAEALGEDTDFVRVDLYDTPDGVFFGELTNYPEAGTKTFTPEEFDRRLGEFWELPGQYSSLLRLDPKLTVVVAMARTA